MSNTSTATGNDTISNEAGQVKADFIKPAGFDANKDWSYLLDKEPSSNHDLFAHIMREKLGKEAVEAASLEQLIYWFLAMHRWMQKSDANQAREGFRGRTLEAVLKGSDTLAGRVHGRIENGEAPEDLLTKDRVHAGVEMPTEKAEGNEEQEAEESEVEAKAPAKVTKADLIAKADELGTELTEGQLKKLTVKKLEDLIATLEA